MSESVLSVTVQKRPGETVDRTLNLRGEIQQAWRAGVEYATNAYVRPTRPNGFDYKVTSAGTGRTSAAEPRWPTTVGGTVTDGSITWTCQAPSTSSCDPLSGSATVTPPTGITATHVSTDPLGDVKLRLAGGTAGQDYGVLVTAPTSGGQSIQCEVIVQVRQ